MLLEILVGFLVLVVLAQAAIIWMLWQRSTPADTSQEVATLKARVAALSTPDLGPLHQMVSRLEAELAELKATPWRGHPARADSENTGVTESPDASKLPAVHGSPLLRPGDPVSAELGGGGEGLGGRLSGEFPIEIPSTDPGEGQGGGADKQPGGNPDAGATPAVRMTLQDATTRAEELLQQTDDPTDRAYLAGLHDRLVNVRQVKDLEAWEGDRVLIFGLYQPVSDIGVHELSDELRPAAQEIAGVLDEARAAAVDHLRTRFGIEVIAPVISTPFDPLVHEDSPTTRLTPPNPNLAHTIYARVGLGLRRAEEVIEKAWVKRYAGYEGPTEVSPEHSEPEVPSSLVPEEGLPVESDNAAKSLLQQAAEHGN